eukprot:3516739-Prymnesium_polylepis.1
MPGEASRLGIVHADDPATPSLAVVVGLGPPEREWVPPFFVDIPANRSYDFDSLTDRPPSGPRRRTSLDAAPRTTTAARRSGSACSSPGATS